MKLAHPAITKSLELAVQQVRCYFDLLESETNSDRAAHLLRAVEVLATDIRTEAASLANQAEKGYLP